MTLKIARVSVKMQTPQTYLTVRLRFLLTYGILSSAWMLYAAAKRDAQPKETDPHKLAQRQKQIDFGKNTLGYAAYTKAVPR